MSARRLVPALLAALALACGSAPQVTPPSLALSAATLTFSGTVGGAAPAAQQVTVTNAGGGTLSTPVATAGASWVTATVSGSAAPYTITVQPSLAGLTAADYQTTVQVASGSAANSPLSIAVRFTVAPEVVAPALSLSASAVEFRAASPGDATAPQVVQASSSTSGALARPTAAVSYGPGGATGWLSVTVSDAPPYDLTFQADSTGLNGGLHVAGVEVASAGATGSPVTVPVTLWIGRVVEVRHLVTFWQEDGSPVELEDPVVTEVAILQPDGQGGLARVVMVPGIAPGSWLALGVPGFYWAELVTPGGPSLLVRATADLVDLGMDLAGRVPRVNATAETLATLTLDNLSGWLPGDFLRLMSWGAQATTELSPAGDPGADPTTFDWATTMRTLLAPSDELWVGHYTLALPENGGATGAFLYLEAQGATSMTGVTMTSGTPQALTPPAISGTTLGTLGLTWKMEAMEAAAAPFVPAAAGFGHRFGLYAVPAPLTVPSPVFTVAGTVIEATSNATALSGLPEIVEPAVSIGRYLPQAWHEYQEVAFSVPVNRLAPGAATPLAGTANVVHARAAATASLVAQPLVGAPLAPTLDGADALQAGLAAATTTPTLAWTAPASPAAAPTSYGVDLVELSASGAATSGRLVASLVLPGDSLQVPPGLLASGKAYAARITARLSPADAGGNTPLRQGMPDGTGSIWTQVFTVQ